MKAATICITLVILATGAASAQDDDTISYVHGLPVTGEDSAQQVPQDDLHPPDSIVQISAKQIPKPLLRTLNETALYKGWQNQVVQFDKNTGLYWLHMRDKTIVRSYGFDNRGKPVSFQERTVKEE
jgi:hypothetical protein